MTTASVECLLCTKRYTAKEIDKGAYCLETMVCLKCYLAMQRRPAVQCCFGKPTIIQPNNKVSQSGYDPKSVECNRLCPDRIPCRRLQEKGSLI